MSFYNSTRGLRIDGTEFEYFSEGAYGLVFVDRKHNLIRKVYRRRHDSTMEHSQQVFRAEVAAYDIASRAEELKDLVPTYFGTRPGQIIIDCNRTDVSSEVYPDLAFETEFVNCAFQKNSVADPAERKRVFTLFQKHGIAHIVDASVCLQDGQILKVIDFAMQEIVLSWDDTP